MILEVIINNKREPAVSFKQASIKFRRYITDNCLGYSKLKFNDGKLFLGKNKIGHVSYNGRVWKLDGQEIKI